MTLGIVRSIKSLLLEEYNHIKRSRHCSPLIIVLFIHQERSVPGLAVEFTQMISVLEHKFDGSVFLKSSDMEIQPIFCRAVKTNICVTFKFDGERGVTYNGSISNISSGEAAIDNNSIGELNI